jgi:hypothetical protein
MDVKLQVRPSGEQYSEEESDVVEIFCTFTGLRIVIETQKRRFVPVLVEVFFRHVNGFRSLDEGDLIRYWENNLLASNHHNYELLSGGWSNAETLDDGLPSVSSGSTRNGSSLHRIDV